MATLGPGQTIVRVVFRQKMHGNAIYNVLHYLPDTPILVGDLIDFAVGCGSAWSGANGPQAGQSTEIELVEVAVQEIAPTVGPLIAAPIGTFGQIAGEAVANQLAIVVSHITNGPGRRGRGRTYLGGYPEAAFLGADGLWNATVATTAALDLGNLEDEASIATLFPGEFVQWSTKARVGGVLQPPEFYAHIGVVGRTIPGVIRSRRIGVGI